MPTVFAAVDPLTALSSYGALGLVVVLFILGRIFDKSTVDRLVQERDRAEQRAETMLQDYKAVVPVLERAIEALRQADAQKTSDAALAARMQTTLEQNTSVLQRVAIWLERR